MRPLHRSGAVPFLHHHDVKSAFLIAVAACAAVACAKTASESEKIVNVRPMAVGAIQPGDCVEARRRAASAPDLEVDRLPTLMSKTPRPFVPTPPSVQADIDRKGMSIKVDVVVDTLGKAVMRTFKVLETSNEWFPRNLKALMPRWTFAPAQLAGCKVQRIYKFSASAKPKA